MKHRDIRRLVLDTFAREGRAPSVAELADRLGLDGKAVLNGLEDLHDAHAVVLGDYGDAIRMAHPFSAAPMGFVVTPAAPYDDRMWWGGCTWDSFGIGAALKLEVVVATRCPGCGRELRMEAGPSRPPGQDWVAHVPRPAREWWHDVIDTCGNLRTFCSAEHLARWSARTGRATGEAVPVARLWRLAQPWYGDRLDPDYRPRRTAASQRLLTEAGFTGDFWRLPVDRVEAVMTGEDPG
ncbi:alkylmercury lyase family protein [Planobispora takensis]|nr:alkylmercury lyase family protein [Planobispora takensis]